MFTHEHESEGIQEDNIEFSIPSDEEDSPGSVFASLVIYGY